MGGGGWVKIRLTHPQVELERELSLAISLNINIKVSPLKLIYGSYLTPVYK